MGQVLAEVQGGACVPLNGGMKQAVQVCAVDGGMRCAVALERVLAQAQHAQFAAAASVAHLQHAGKGGDLRQCILQAPIVQQARHVGTELNAGADFAEDRGAFEQAYVPAGAATCQRRGHAANTAPRDQRLFCHGRDFAAL